jgi:hypothetical protein
MKKVEVTLSVPRLVDGKMRYPSEGAIHVEEGEAKRIVADKAGEIVGKAKSTGKDD